jgi:thioredoxin-like negative regulator of GroEL
MRGARSHSLESVDLAELGVDSPPGDAVVQFVHPLCTDCRTLARRLANEGRTVVTVDVASRPDLARKYGIAVVPTAVVVAPDGQVQVRLAG